MPPLAGYWHSLLTRHVKVWKAAAKQISKSVQNKAARHAQAELQPVLVRSSARQPLHPAARIRQSQSRWFSSSSRSSFKDAVRRFTSIAEQSTGTRHNRAALPKSSVGNAVIRHSGRAPFATTLRPNITGGTLGRTAGGYSLGGGRVGGQRYFSHGPASQAQVIQNVSQAVRAFFVSGQKAQFNGVNARGEKQYKAVSNLQDDTGRKLRSLPKQTPGSYIAFPINPTITALTPLELVAGYTNTDDHVNTEGLLDVLSADFSRSLKDLAAVLSDLNKLSNLGDLPITYEASSLRIHFPGCDADTVDRLRDELQIQRGTTVQDDNFDSFVGSEIALLFPFAPSTQISEGSEFYESPSGSHTRPIEWQTMLTPSASSEGCQYTLKSETLSDLDFEFDSPNMPSDYESLQYSSPSEHEPASSPLEYQGFEGIHRFIEMCDSHRR